MSDNERTQTNPGGQEPEARSDGNAGDMDRKPSAQREDRSVSPEPNAETQNSEYWRAEAKRAFGCRDEARRELSAARELADKAAAEAAERERFIAELVERKLLRLPARTRELVPESLPVAERLRYLIDNEALLAPMPGAAVPGAEKPAGQPGAEQAFESMGYAERLALYRADPERYRRLADAALARRAREQSCPSPAGRG